jgi:hypothetical protein
LKIPEKDARRAVLTAFNWHGGGGSPLYSFASTRTVWSDDHRDRACREVVECLGLVRENHDQADALFHLIGVLRMADVGEEVIPAGRLWPVENPG